MVKKWITQAIFGLCPDFGLDVQDEFLWTSRRALEHPVDDSPLLYGLPRDINPMMIECWDTVCDDTPSIRAALG